MLREFPQLEQTFSTEGSDDLMSLSSVCEVLVYVTVSKKCHLISNAALLPATHLILEHYFCNSEMSQTPV